MASDGHSSSRRQLRRRGWGAALGAALLLAGCAGGTLGEAGNPGEDAPPKKQNFIEPIGQRSPYGNFLAGRYAERHKDFARAATALNRALDDFPNDISLIRQTFYLALEGGMADMALRLAHRLEEEGAGVSVSELLLASESMRRGDFEVALRRLEKIKREELARFSVPLALAWAHAGMKEPTGGVAALAALESEGGVEALQRLHEALIWDFAGQNKRADAAYSTAIGDSPERAPNRIVQAYGLFLERSGKSGKAKTLYDSFRGADMDGLLFEAAQARIAAGTVPEPRIATAADGMAEAFFDIASILPKDRAGEIVLIYCRLALYLRPDFPLAQLLAADVYEGYDRHREAAELHSRVKDGAYGWAARLRLAGNIYDLGDKDGAIRLLREMASERPERSDPLVRLGNILRSEERFAEAVEAYDAAIARMGELYREDWPILYSRGIALEKSNQWERAEKDFLHALKLEPDQPFVLNYLGYSWVEKGINLMEAKAMLVRAVAQRQDDGYIVDSLGWALYRLGEFAEAVVYLERAVALQPQDPELNNHLGDAYWRVGRTGEAMIQWRRVLGLDPDDDLRKSVGRKLEMGLPPSKQGGAGG